MGGGDMRLLVAADMQKGASGRIEAVVITQVAGPVISATEKIGKRAKRSRIQS